MYQEANGTYPFEIWLDGLKDIKARAIIKKRINRLRLGNLGDCKPLGDGIMELRIHYGLGYRIYVALYQKKDWLLLLLGGAKSKQSKDIHKAKLYWKDFLS